MLSILPRVGVGSPPGASHRAEGIIARLRGSAREKYTPWGPPHDVALPGGGIPPGGVLALTPPREGRHHIAREPRQLLLEALEEEHPSAPRRAPGWPCCRAWAPRTTRPRACDSHAPRP